MLADFHFLRPLWLLLPLAVGAMALLLPRLREARQGAWRPFVDEALAPWVLVSPGTAPTRTGWTRSIGVLAVALLGIACAGPTWERQPRPQVVSGHALFIALDLSRSMLAEDIRPSRLVRARFKLADLIASRGAAQTGLLVYAADAFMVAPLTSDIETLRLQLPVLEPSLMPVQGSRADRAYIQAARLLQESGFPGGDILLVTDGVSDPVREGLVEACQEHGNALWILASATESGAPVPGLTPREAPNQGVVMSRLELSALQDMARACGGQAVQLSNDNVDVMQIRQALELSALGDEAVDAQLDAMEWIDRGPWLLLLLLPLIAVYARGQALGLLWFALLLTPAPEASAQDWWRLWEHPDERAQALLEQADPEQARQVFEDPRWKAWAAAEAGELADAVELLAGADDADSLYNRGTALAKLGRFPEALETLDAALSREPDHADARFNRDLIARMLEGQQDGSGQDASGDDASDASKGEPKQGQQEPSDAGTPESRGAPDDGSEAPSEQPPEGGGASPSATEPEDGEPEARPGADEAQREAQESAQATEQWLTRIPDDPGGLLRNKFLYQSQRRRTAAPPDQEPPW